MTGQIAPGDRPKYQCTTVCFLLNRVYKSCFASKATYSMAGMSWKFSFMVANPERHMLSNARKYLEIKTTIYRTFYAEYLAWLKQ